MTLIDDVSSSVRERHGKGAPYLESGHDGQPNGALGAFRQDKIAWFRLIGVRHERHLVDFSSSRLRDLVYVTRSAMRPPYLLKHEDVRLEVQTGADYVKWTRLHVDAPVGVEGRDSEFGQWSSLAARQYEVQCNAAAA